MMTSSGFARDVYRRVLDTSAKILGAERTKRLDSRFRFGRKLDLKNPKTLSDKICWIELNADQSLAARCTDKYAVRSYVEEKGLAHILVPLVGGPWVDIESIDLNALPRQFVLKATHGCEMNYIVKDKLRLDCADLMAKARLWLEEDYPRACIEPHYQLVPHRLYAEKFIGGLGDVVDYKFHCVNGNPGFVLTCSNREDSLKLNLYDLDWNPIPGLRGPMKNGSEIPRPEKLDEMISIAQTLSTDFDFVRVDLYEESGRVLFGELTFSPACGVMEYYTNDFVTEWGERLHVKGIES